MSTQKERRRSKKLEKQRKKREDAQRSRGSRKPVGTRGTVALDEAVDWPVSECWIGEPWHETGARVHAVFTRRHDDGRVAIAAFEVDLADQGVIEARATAGVSEGAVQGEVARRSEEHAMVEASPSLVVTLVDAARRHGSSRGHAQPADLDRVTILFGDIEADDARHGIRCGSPDAPEEAPPARPGILATLKRRLGLGGDPG